MKKIFIAAGGTAGHINAALAVGDYYEDKGHFVRYFSGQRYLDYKLFNNDKTNFIHSYPLRSKNPFKVFSSAFKNLNTLLKLFFEFKREKPDLVVGAGGYVCGPTLLAAKLNGVKIFIIEQNAVMGLTNRILSVLADKIFVHFKNTLKLPKSFEDKVVVSGNPVRSSIKVEQLQEQTKVQNILVFGGSLGASQINNIVFNLIQDKTIEGMHIIHQVGKNNLKSVEAHSKIAYEQYEYIDDMASLYDWCDLIICRAGASTISELRIVGRPSVLVPFPNATDNHQYFNALELQNENLFPMLVIDYRKNTQEMIVDVKAFLKNLKEIDLSSYKNIQHIDPSEIIYKESQDVWNK